MSMMLFIFLCFAGLFVMFFYILRGQESVLNVLRTEQAQTRAQMRALESRLAALSGDEVPPSALKNGALQDPAGGPDSLSMQADTAPPATDKNLELKF